MKPSEILVALENDDWFPSTETTEMADHLERLLPVWVASTPENTVVNTKRALSFYLPLCERLGIPAYPLTEAGVLAYIEDRTGSVLGRTIEADLSLLRIIDAFAHNAVASPLVTTAAIKMAVKAAKIGDKKADQVTPIHYSDIEYWYQANIEYDEKGKLQFMRNNALFRLCYDGLLRIDEAVSMNYSNLAASSATFLIEKSKKDQDKEGADQFMAGSTIAALSDYILELENRLGRPLEPEEPVFWSFFAGGRPKSRLSVRGAREVVTQSFSEIEGVSGHSFRIGACQDMGINQISLPMIMHSGRWKSPTMVAYYLRKMAAKQSGMAKLANLQNR